MQSLPTPVTPAPALAAALIQAFAPHLNTSQAIHHLLAAIGCQLEVDACVVMGHYQAADSLVYAGWYGQDTPLLGQLGPNLLSPAVEARYQLALALIQQGIDPSSQVGDLPWPDALAKLFEDQPQFLSSLPVMQAQAALAIAAAPACQGVLLLLSRHGACPPDLDETRRADLAGVLAIALHQYHLQQQAQRSVEQLRYLNYLKEDFLSTLNHELRTPLTSMRLAIRMLRRPDLTPERAAMYLEILDQQCAREINLINDLLMLQAVDAGLNPSSLETIDLAAWLANLGAEASSVFARANLTLVLNLPPEPVWLETSPVYLAQAMQELFTNACKYSAPATTVTLTLLPPGFQDGVARVRLTNWGEGIRSEELPHIFDRFNRGRSATQNAIPGTGAGLALVRGLIKKIGAKISVTSQPGGDQLWQTSFTLEFKLHRNSTQVA